MKSVILGLISICSLLKGAGSSDVWFMSDCIEDLFELCVQWCVWLEPLIGGPSWFLGIRLFIALCPASFVIVLSWLSWFLFLRLSHSSSSHFLHISQLLGFCHTPNPGCDQPEANIHLCLRSLDLLVTYWKSGMTSPIQGGCLPVNDINRKQ